MAQGWDKVGDPPEDPRDALAAAVLEQVRRANASGQFDGLRDRFPPAYLPFLPQFEDGFQRLPLVMLLATNRILLRVGPQFHLDPRMVILQERALRELPRDLITVGRCPNRRFFAVAKTFGVTLHDGWEGPKIAEFRWPIGLEGLPDGIRAATFESAPNIESLIPFPSGDRVLLVSGGGIFVLSKGNAVRLVPDEAEIAKRLQRWKDEKSNEPFSIGLSMVHAAISPDGRFIAVGHQDSRHVVLDGKTYQPVGKIDPCSEYPHYAVFSSDSKLLALNACYFEGGITVGVPTNLLPGLNATSSAYKPDDERLKILEDDACVYSAVWRRDEFIIGDRFGNLRAFDATGRMRWQHVIGSTIEAIDVSPDGKHLVATSVADFVCLIDLEPKEADPFTRCTASHRELRRWIFWQKEKRPLVW